MKTTKILKLFLLLSVGIVAGCNNEDDIHFSTQRIVLIDKGKSDQHITVQNASIIITLTASSIPGYGTDRKRRTVTAILFFFVDIDYTIFHTVIAAVIKIKI